MISDSPHVPIEIPLIRLMRRFAIGLLFTAMAAVSVAEPASAEAAGRPRLLDDKGRELVPGGFVVLEKIRYTQDDYRRMVSMGASFQVIRMPVGLIGGWPGTEADPKAMEHFDELVRLGKEAGLRTIFKLVFYGVPPFGDAQWDMIWNNKDGIQDRLIQGWSLIWERYKDDDSVFGYDILNEPAIGLDTDYERIQRDKLLPLLRRMSDRMWEISPAKWVLYQPLLRKPGDQTTKHRDPVVAMDEPFGRERIIYAPHLYQMNTAVIAPMLDALERQAVISDAPLLLGEWGSPTYSDTDGDAELEANHARVYQKTVAEMDDRCVGGIKAWFCGARKPIPVSGGRRWMTWSIFSDRSPAGRVERKYIMDVVVRPRPLVVAGRLERFGTDFKTMTFTMNLEADPKLGATEVFIPAERHYPNGFRLSLGKGLTMDLEPNGEKLRVSAASTEADRKQAGRIHWDGEKSRLTIDRWEMPAGKLVIRVRPLKLDQ